LVDERRRDDAHVERDALAAGPVEERQLASRGHAEVDGRACGDTAADLGASRTGAEAVAGSCERRDAAGGEQLAVRSGDAGRESHDHRVEPVAAVARVIDLETDLEGD